MEFIVGEAGKSYDPLIVSLLGQHYREWEELARLHHELPGLTVLYVTHDQTEALTLAHRIAILRDGRLVAHGGARDLYREPPKRFTAELLGRVTRGARGASVSRAPSARRPRCKARSSTRSRTSACGTSR